MKHRITLWIKIVSVAVVTTLLLSRCGSLPPAGNGTESNGVIENGSAGGVLTFPHPADWKTGANHGAFVTKYGYGQCSSCHGADQTSKDGGTANVNCVSCHAKHESKPASCNQCHEGGRPPSPHVANLDCQLCHSYALAKFEPLKDTAHASNPTTCVACHERDRPAPPHISQTDCASCHVFSNTSFAMDPSVAHASKPTSCVSCHAKDRPEPPHNSDLDCVTCHSFETKTFIASQSVAHASNPVTCVGCHEAKRPPAPHNDTLDCVRCHNPKSAGFAASSDVAHAANPTSCVSCHERNRPAPPHEATADCVTCHSLISSSFVALKDTAHAPGPSSCVACHEIDRPAPPHDATQDCAFCHNYADKTFVPEGGKAHDSNPISCINCHSNDRPAAPHNQTLDCATCHTFATGAFTPVKAIAHTQVPTSCVGCHESDRPAAPHVASLDCVNCHSPAATGFVPDAAIAHASSLANACVSCHASESMDLAASAHAESTSPVYTGHNSAGCARCHNKDAFQDYVGSTDSHADLIDFVASNASQTLTFSGGPTGGVFTIAYGGVNASPISYSTDFSTLTTNIATALAGIPAIGSTSALSFTGVSSSVLTAGAVVQIGFQGSLAGNTVALTKVSAALTGGVSPNVAVSQSGFPLPGSYDCKTCHNSVTNGYKTNGSQITFTSGAVIPASPAAVGREGVCIKCHSGRTGEAAMKINAAISGAPLDTKLTSGTYTFAQYPGNTAAAGTISSATNKNAGISIHYYPAAAVQFGSLAGVGYQYSSSTSPNSNAYPYTYVGKNEHVPGRDTCVGCHSPHTLAVQIAACQSCHTNAAFAANANPRNIRRSDTPDYDGDGNIAVGVNVEIESLMATLLTAIKNYTQYVVGGGNTIDYLNFYQTHVSPAQKWCVGGTIVSSTTPPTCTSYPAGSWTPRLLRASFNYQLAAADPGRFAHNPKYIVQLLYDSLVDMNAGMTAAGQSSHVVNMTGMIRPQDGPVFNGP